MDNEKLIELVKGFNELYDLSHHKYSDKQHKELVWTTIGVELNLSAKACKRGWINLRDAFRRAFKKKRLAKNGTSAMKIRKWKFEDQMSFLIPFFFERDSLTYTKEEISDEIETTRSVVLAESENIPRNSKNKSKLAENSLKPRKRKLISSSTKNLSSATGLSVPMKFSSDKVEEQNLIGSSDAIDTFFIGIAQTVKTFSRYHQNIIKSKIFSIVSDMEMEEILNSSESVPAFPTPVSPQPPNSPNNNIEPFSPASSFSSG